ncbi:MAG: hypothetical protein EBQ49_05480 [Verrucomicrobia bacterium]|nr:hypothetical protein [Verrucomicrobiota bacterium]
MTPLVLKEWKASNKPVDDKGNWIKISGRASGLLSWILALLQVDPTTTICISEKRLEFSVASLSGTEHRIIPLASVSSTFYGYHKPWKQAVLLFFIFGYVTISLCSLLHIPLIGYIFGLLLSTIIALIYYNLNRSLTLGFIELSGVASAIQFKRSVIENIDVDEKQAKYVSDLSQYLIESAKK